MSKAPEYTDADYRRMALQGLRMLLNQVKVQRECLQLSKSCFDHPVSDSSVQLTLHEKQGVVFRGKKLCEQNIYVLEIYEHPFILFDTDMCNLVRRAHETTGGRDTPVFPIQKLWEYNAPECNDDNRATHSSFFSEKTNDVQTSDTDLVKRFEKQ